MIHSQSIPVHSGNDWKGVYLIIHSPLLKGMDGLDRSCDGVRNTLGSLEGIGSSRKPFDVWRLRECGVWVIGIDVGRPRALDDLAAERVVQAVAKGYPRDTAAKLAGIAPTTLFKYLRLGREGDPDYAEFAKRVKRAEAESETELIDRVRDASRVSWQAAAWMLERRRPQRYSLRRAEVVQQRGGTIAQTSPEQTKALLESLLKAVESAA